MKDQTEPITKDLNNEALLDVYEVACDRFGVSIMTDVGYRAWCQRRLELRAELLKRLGGRDRREDR